jgi:Xaa-Pro aminopeptidase
MDNKLAKAISATKMTEKALKATLPFLKPGVSEMEIEKAIIGIISKLGGELSFPPIVAFGIRSATPHHKSTNRKLKYNDLVLIDLGAKYDNFCGDITRVFSFGKPTAKFINLYNLVLRAQLLAIENIRSGMTYARADALAFSVFKDAGFSRKETKHALGHGIGKLVHEGFTLSPKEKECVLKEGDIFTIEPGLYLKNWGGIRIEDVVVVKNGRVKVLSKYPKELTDIAN